MMKFTVSFIVCILTIFFNPVMARDPASSYAVTIPPPPLSAEQTLFNGTWQNDLGSQVHLFIDHQGMVSGHYQTNVGEPDKSKQFPLTGWASGDQISFTVSFQGFGSITAWVGQVTIVNGAEILKTQWHLTRDIEDAEEAEEMWGSVRSNASPFTRVE